MKEEFAETETSLDENEEESEEQKEDLPSNDSNSLTLTLYDYPQCLPEKEESYIVEFVHDATERYYERGKHGYMHLNNVKFPLFMLKFLKFHLYCLPMLATLCFMDLFFYKIIFHRKWVRLKCVSYLLLDAPFSLIHITYVSIFSNNHAHLNGYKERAFGRQPIMLYFLFC